MTLMSVAGHPLRLSPQQHLSGPLLEEGLRSGRLLSGILHVNSFHRQQAVVRKSQKAGQSSSSAPVSSNPTTGFSLDDEASDCMPSAHGSDDLEVSGEILIDGEVAR